MGSVFKSNGPEEPRIRWEPTTPMERGNLGDTRAHCTVKEISGTPSIFSTLCGKWQQRCGLSPPVLQQLVTNSEATQTELGASSVVEDHLVGRVEANASHDVADLGTVDHAVTAVPEVEQIEHVSHVCDTRTSPQTHPTACSTPTTKVADTCRVQ